MLEHIEITGEGGIIRLKWEWDDPEIESLDIHYRKKEYEKAAPFQTRILHDPQKKFGYVEKKMSGERGLYSFLIIAHFQSGDVEEKWVVAPQNMIFTKEQIWEKVLFTEQYFDSEIIM